MIKDLRKRFYLAPSVSGGYHLRHLGCGGEVRRNVRGDNYCMELSCEFRRVPFPDWREEEGETPDKPRVPIVLFAEAEEILQDYRDQLTTLLNPSPHESQRSLPFFEAGKRP